MASLPRLRQVALVARRLGPVAEHLEQALGLDTPFHDEGVGEFGLENAVWAVAGDFLEVVAPVRDGTAAGRHLDRRGGDGGYMALFEVADVREARQRVADLGVRVVWQVDLPDMAGTHLHPGDVPGAIVSLDQARPAGSWRWGGPAWTGTVPAHGPGGFSGLTVESADPAATADRWAAVLGVAAEAAQDGHVIVLDEGAQRLRFATPADDRGDGITEVVVAALGAPVAGTTAEVGGVRFRLRPAAASY